MKYHLRFNVTDDQLDALAKNLARWSLIAISIVIAFVLLVFLLSAAHAQTPLQAQSQVYTNQFPSGRITNAVVQGETNVVPVQPWTVQVIEVITILRSQRDELRAMLTNTPLLSLQTNPPTASNALIGPVEPPKTPKRKPR